MDNAERQRLERLLRAHQRRLGALEQQTATFGLRTPPEITIEVEDLRQKIADIEKSLKITTPAIDHTSLRRLQQLARTAYFQRNWEQAADLLTQVVAADPEDSDSQEKLIEARKQLRLQANYYAICDLRDAGMLRAVLDALDDLERRQPGYPDPEGLWQWAESFPLFPVCVGDKWGYIDKTGSVVIKPEFDQAIQFSEGLARVVVKTISRYGYIDKSGKMVIEPQFDGATWFSEGLMEVMVGKKWGYIDKSGKIVIGPQFDETTGFSDGLAGVKIGEKWGYIDKRGKIVIGLQFNEAVGFSERLGGVKVGAKWGYIDRTGYMWIEPQFDSIGDWSNVSFGFYEGLALVGVMKGAHREKWGYIDKVGKLVIEPQFDGASYFSEGMAKVKTGGKWGYIDKVGKLVIEPQFDGAFWFSEGLAGVKIGDKWGYIDKVGKLVIEPQFDDAFGFSQGLAEVKVEDKRGYIDKKGGYICRAIALEMMYFV